MLTRVFSAALRGVDAIEVEIEVNASSGDPMIVIVGLPDTSVRESRDRVTTAIANSGLRWPRTRTTVNLAPADLKKEGPSFDLPIALGMIATAQGVELKRFERCLVAGELGLNGEVRAVKGALSIALEARRRRKRAVLLPEPNAREAAVVHGIEVYGVKSLRDAYEFLNRTRELDPETPLTPESWQSMNPEDEAPDFAEVKGQEQVRRAIEIAVAGGHNILVIGSINTNVQFRPNLRRQQVHTWPLRPFLSCSVMKARFAESSKHRFALPNPKHFRACNTESM